MLLTIKQYFLIKIMRTFLMATTSQFQEFIPGTTWNAADLGVVWNRFLLVYKLLDQWELIVPSYTWNINYFG